MFAEVSETVFSGGDFFMAGHTLQEVNSSKDKQLLPEDINWPALVHFRAQNPVKPA